MNFTSAELSAWIGSFMWPFFRIGAMLMAAPVFGARVVMARVRLGLALAITVVVAPVLAPMPAVDPLSAPGIFITAHQILIGVAMGLALRLVFTALEMAGQVVSHLMGLGFASMVDPQNGVQVPVLGQFYTIMGILMFLALNGHLVLIEVLVSSFTQLPVGVSGLSPEAFYMLVLWGGQMFAGGVLIALPAVAALFMANITFGVITRTSPQLNIFAVGFPAIMLFGFVVLLFSLSGLPAQLTRLVDAAFQTLAAMIGG